MTAIKGTLKRKSSGGTLDDLHMKTDISLVEGYDAAAQAKLVGNTILATATWFTTNNPVLREGQFGQETDTSFMKVGDGTHNWNALQYIGVPATGIAIEIDDGNGGYVECGETALYLEIIPES